MKICRLVSPSLILAVVLAILVLSQETIAAAPATEGRRLYDEALAFERKLDLFKAFDKYTKAKARFVKEGNEKGVDQCRAALTRIESVTMTYSYAEVQVRNLMRKNYPDVPEARQEEVIRAGRMPSLLIGGKRYYFTSFRNTLYHLYPDFRATEQSSALGAKAKLIDAIKPYIYPKNPSPSGRALVNPITYQAEGEVKISRDKLPAKGLLRVWIPLPLVTAAQPDVEIISVTPEKYLAYPIRLDGDIGLAYMEIPVEELREDLTIGVKFRFRHYEERVDVDPAKVGSYDKRSELYARYTASRGNIAVTPAIRETARKIAGKETNPYRIAKKFYDHIVYNLDYSFTPHLALQPLGIPESVYVHEHGYGDCGAQSMYFAALCRAVGIPARSAGGYQLFPINEAGAGPHFWAQFYLPNYGWIPVDTSAGQIIKYMKEPSEKLKHDFIEYFFSRMDPYRFLIQVDVDIPFLPAPKQTPIFGAVLQEPTAECAEMDEHAGFLLLDRWKLRVRQVKKGLKAALW